MRKLFAATATIIVMLVGSLVWASPAQAAPGGACSIEEWSKPSNWTDCAKRGAQSVDAKTGCVTAPEPGSPTEGMAGWLTSEPDSALRDGVGGRYSTYGVGGYGLDTYDVGCLGTVSHPERASMTWLANLEFQGAASIMGGANGLREHAYDPGSVWSWANGFLEDVTHATYKYVFHPVGGLTICLIGVFLIYRARRGQLSQAFQVTAWAIMVAVVVTVVASWPVKAANGVDTVATKGLTLMHSVAGPAKQDIPDDQCIFGPGDEGCKDHRDAATRASDVAVDTVLYKPWLRAVLGDSESTTAQTYGPALYDATTFSWAEAALADSDPNQRQQIIERKAQTWNEIAAKIQHDDPVAYSYLQGNHGTDRVFAGAIAILSAATFSVFDMTASVVILFAFGIIRIAILLLPVLGTVGLFKYTSSGVRRIFHMTTAAVFNIIAFGAYAGIYLKAVGRVFDSDMPGPVKILVIALVGVAAMLALHPFRHLYSTATGRPRSDTSVIARGRRAAAAIQQENTAQYGRAVAAGPPADREQADAAARPENRRRAWRQAKTVGQAGAPAVTTPPAGPTYTAARAAILDPANQRPENGSRTTHGKTLVGAVVSAVSDANTRTPAIPAIPAPQPRPEKKS